MSNKEMRKKIMESEFTEIDGVHHFLASGKYKDTHGVPLAFQMIWCKEYGAKLSLLHFADYMIKSGAKVDGIMREIQEAITDSGENVDISKIRDFCMSEYEVQRGMIFEYLFLDMESAKTWAAPRIKLFLS